MQPAGGGQEGGHATPALPSPQCSDAGAQRGADVDTGQGGVGLVEGSNEALQRPLEGEFEERRGGGSPGHRWREEAPRRGPGRRRAPPKPSPGTVAVFSAAREAEVARLHQEFSLQAEANLKRAGRLRVAR